MSKEQISPWREEILENLLDAIWVKSRTKVERKITNSDYDDDDIDLVYCTEAKMHELVMAEASELISRLIDKEDELGI